MVPVIDTWESVIQKYLDSRLAVNALSEKTAKTRFLLLSEFGRFAISNKIEKPSKAHKNLVLAFFSQKKVANNTKRVQFFILHAFFDYLVEEDLVPENCMTSISPPSEKNIESDYLDDEEVRLFFEGVIDGCRETTIERTLLIVVFLTALCLRVSEASNLKISDLNMDQGTVRVHRKGGTEVLLPLSTDLMEFLKRWLSVRTTWKNGETSPWLFITERGTHMAVRSIQHVCKKALEKSGILKRRMGPHLLRHSGASGYLASGIDIKTIQTLLGHSNVATTSKYVHASRGRLEQAVESFKLPKSQVSA